MLMTEWLDWPDQIDSFLRQSDRLGSSSWCTRLRQIAVLGLERLEYSFLADSKCQENTSDVSSLVELENKKRQCTGQPWESCCTLCQERADIMYSVKRHSTKDRFVPLRATRWTWSASRDASKSVPSAKCLIAFVHIPRSPWTCTQTATGQDSPWTARAQAV